VWRSPVAHLLWEQGVGGSNPLTPTNFSRTRRARALSEQNMSAGGTFFIFLVRHFSFQIAFTAPVAQWIEQQPSKLWVASSILARRTIYFL
jgi:hypothetical protein